MKPNISKIGCLFIILYLCLVAVHTQRGGSRSSSSRSSSSSHHSSYWGHHHSTTSNCTTVNGTTTCITKDSQMDLSTALIILAVFGGLVVIGVISSNKDEERRKVTIAQAMKQYEARMEQFSPTTGEDERNIMIDTFMKKSYTMVVNVKDKSQKFYCQVKVLDLKKLSDMKYQIKLSGSDEVGKSVLEGLLVFRGNGLGLKLSKVYDNRSAAEQTGKFDILLYEGYGSSDKMEGEWAFNGYESSTEYSGTWNMVQI